MPKYFTALLFLFLVGCAPDNNTRWKTDSLKLAEFITHDSSTQTEVEQPDSSSSINTETVFLDTSVFPTYFNSTNPVIFADTAFIYSGRDTSGKIIARLAFNTPVEILDPGGYWFNWYQIRFGNDTGYVRTSEVAIHKFTSHPTFHYFLVTGYSPKYNPSHNGFSIYKFNVRQQKFVDTFFVAETRADLVKELNHTSWKNTDFLLYTWQVDAYCGGRHPQLYIIDANNKFEQLFYTYTEMNDGEEGGGAYANVQFPKNVETDTIIYHEYREVPVQSKNGRPLKNPDGSFKMKLADDTTRYYRWDGFSMKNVRTVVGKK